MATLDITGQKYEMLTAVRLDHKNKHGRPMWLCRCDCGNEVVVNMDNLRSGNSKSCGCQKGKINAGCFKPVHGMSKTPDYGRWSSMMDRCYLPSHHAYKDYGARGIYVCERWHTFENYLADMGPRPEGKSLDRIDNNGPYSPENCRWVTQKEQIANRRDPWITRRAEYMHTVNGVAKTIAEWAKAMGVNKTTLYRKLAKGYSLESLVGAK